MPKVAIAIEQPGPLSAWSVVSGPSDDVAGILATARAESVARGNGDGVLMVLSSTGIEKRYKIGPKAQTNPKKRGS